MRTRLAFALAAGLLGSSAWAALPPFSELDLDGNGRLTERELGVLEAFQGEDSDFVEADLDDDRSLSPDEYQAWVEREEQGQGQARR